MDCIIRLPQALALVGLSRSQLYRLEARGAFPKRLQLTGARSIGWRLSDVEDWIASRSPDGSHPAAPAGDRLQRR